MFKYHQNYCREGIDTITLRIERRFVAHPEIWFSSKGDHSFTLRKKNGCFYISLQEEVFNPCLNYVETINWKIVELIKNGFINPIGFYGEFSNDIEIFFWVSLNLKKMLVLQSLDFHFDFQRIMYKVPGFYATTTYSKDRRKKHCSLWKLYDRRPYLIKTRHIKEGSQAYFDVMDMPFPWRLELHLDLKNSNYLNLENINGNLIEIQMRYAAYIAKSWIKHSEEIGNFYPDCNMQFFNYLQAFRGIPTITNTGLLRTDL